MASALGEVRLTSLCFDRDKVIVARKRIAISKVWDQPRMYLIHTEAEYSGIPRDAAQKINEELEREQQDIAGRQQHEEGGKQHDGVSEELRWKPIEALNKYVAENSNKFAWSKLESNPIPVAGSGFDGAAQEVDGFLTEVHDKLHDALFREPSSEFMRALHVPDSLSGPVSDVFTEIPLSIDRYLDVAKRVVYGTETLVGLATNQPHLVANGVQRFCRDITTSAVEEGLEKLEKLCFGDKTIVEKNVEAAPARGLRQQQLSDLQASPESSRQGRQTQPQEFQAAEVAERDREAGAGGKRVLTDDDLKTVTELLKKHEHLASQQRPAAPEELMEIPTSSFRASRADEVPGREKREQEQELDPTPFPDPTDSLGP